MILQIIANVRLVVRLYAFFKTFGAYSPIMMKISGRKLGI